ncbi:RpiB/LacA/LacB family sugar-phosphate isomerase [Candidatus Wolfebacteria bacterium]|nr:RpiB/LacA/LacB family sugar-phosphate isomerase [Candidatus Wolfebacteria bacterium]
MLIYIGADHRGFQLKEKIKNILKEKGYQFVDVGNAQYDENDDYPEFAALVASRISQDPIARRGIVICGSGVGVDVVANKFKEIRSALVNSPDQAYLSRNDDDANILSLSAEFINENNLEKILLTWLTTPFSNQEKHKRRIEKIREIENNI